MNIFTCDGTYENDLKKYNDNILTESGIFSPGAVRAMMHTADLGNIVAKKFYADMLYYGKILSSHPYRDAFSLYLESAGISIDGEGNMSCSGRSYPHAFRMVGIYLTDYRKRIPLKDCETIEAIDSMTYEARLRNALMLAVSCADVTGYPGALNLIGRILFEASSDKELYEALLPTVSDELGSHDFAKVGLKLGSMDSSVDWIEASEECLNVAAEEGYAYACNNKAAHLADLIVDLIKNKGQTEEDLGELIIRYREYLRVAADQYEPYAANRLGLLYMTGEIRDYNGDYVICRSQADKSKAREYFIKATKYPDSNSAWAYYNLIKYFHKDYDTNIELMNEHMDYIRELNPAVYDLAMEL